VSEPLIVVDNLHRHYEVGGEVVRALDGVSFTIPRGEFVAIVGQSGSGKSTLMNLLGCLDTPTSGLYRLNGADVQGLADDQLADLRNKEIGFVFQTFQLLGRATALANVELPLVYRGVPKRQRRAQASVFTDTREDAVVVPIQAVTVRPEKELKPGGAPSNEGSLPQPAVAPGKKPKRDPMQKVVFVVQDGVAKIRAVETGLASDTEIEIVSGLAESEKVVEGPYRVLSRDLADGKRVAEQGANGKGKDKGKDGKDGAAKTEQAEKKG